MSQVDRRSFLGLAGAGITTGLLGCGGWVLVVPMQVQRVLFLVEVSR